MKKGNKHVKSNSYLFEKQLAKRAKIANVEKLGYLKNLIMEKFQEQRQGDDADSGRKIREATLQDGEIRRLREKLRSLLVGFATHKLVGGELRPCFADQNIQEEYDHTVLLIEERHEEIKRLFGQQNRKKE